MSYVLISVGGEITASNVGVDFTNTIIARVSALILIPKTMSKSVKLCAIRVGEI